MIQKVTDISPIMGCDPEFFFKFKGEVIGAEKFIPKTGLEHNDVNGGGVSKFIIDGVQAELNPRPNFCRANLANEIKACFVLLKKELDNRGGGIEADFSRAVEISKENLMELDEASRKFGCAPSMSAYRKKAGIDITKVNPTEYRVRAAGGHIHIGKANVNNELIRALTTDHKKTVRMLDLLCGNTAVLVDRDEANIERRKVYGKAGEFRLPEHGLEYRTLSNFWLTSYPLMSFAFGLARLAVQLVADENHEEFYSEFTSKVKPKKVSDAINNNDFDLAMENFMAIRPLMLDVIGDRGSRYPISHTNIRQFEHFVKMVNEEGMQYWFPDDPLKHWTNIREAHTGGFYDYLRVEVAEDMTKPKEAKAVKKAA